MMETAENENVGREIMDGYELDAGDGRTHITFDAFDTRVGICAYGDAKLSLIHISEPTRP